MLKKMRSWKFIVLVAVVAAAAISVSVFAGAIWSSDDAVHIKSSEVENSTLAIGTHLIHLSALNDQLYEIAEKSATDSGQTDIYYKSELANGTWFNITSARSLDDITKSGTPVKDSVVEALYFTYSTKSDGVTYDLRTGAAVNIYNISNPYDVSSMPELEPLVNQYKLIDGSKMKDKGDITDRINKILEANVQDMTTLMSDQTMNYLSRAKTVIKNANGGEQQLSEVETVMAGVDAERRIHVYQTIYKLLETYSDELGAAETINSDLLSAVTESMSNIEDSENTYQGKLLSEGTSVYQSVVYKYQQALIAAAKSSNDANITSSAARLVDLTNIMQNVISNRATELTALTDELLPAATTRYANALSAGENADYKAQKSAGKDESLLNSLISQNTSTDDGYRSELEFFITALTMRKSTDDSLSFISDRITLTKNWYGTIPQDAFLDGATSSADSHMAYLSGKQRELQLKKGGSELDKLADEKAELQKKQKGALDNNDLEGAQGYADQISAIDDQINTLENESVNDITSLNKDISDLSSKLSDAENAGDSATAANLRSQLAGKKAELSAVENALSDGSLGKQIASLKTDAQSLIKSGEVTDSTVKQVESKLTALEGLSSLAPKLAFPALTELHSDMAAADATNNNSKFSDAMTAVENAISDNASAYAAAMRTEKSASDLSGAMDDFFNNGNGSGSGTGTGTGTGSGSGSTGSLLNSTGSGTGSGASAGGSSGVKIPTLSRSELLNNYSDPVKLLALENYYEQTGNTGALELINSLAQSAAASGSKYIYTRISGNKYIPLSAIHACTGLRYVVKTKGTAAYLAQGAQYYGFSLYSTKVTRSKDGKKVEYMPKAAAYLSELHIGADYSYDTFGVDCVYLSGSNLAVVKTDQLSALADELLAKLLA